MADDIKVGDVVEYWRTIVRWYDAGGMRVGKRAVRPTKRRATVLELKQSSRGTPIALLQDLANPQRKMNRYVRGLKKKTQHRGHWSSH